MAFQIRKFFRYNGLTLVLCVIFVGTWLAQFYCGFHENNENRADHSLPPLSFFEYSKSGHFWQATGENWESEFLQMGLFTILTVFLFQRGSPESNGPDEPQEISTPAITPKSPWPVRRGGIILLLYSHSLSLAFLALFIASMAIHAKGGLLAVNDERIALGRAPETIVDYITGARFWFESLQNWQSEFLSLAAMVFLSVYLREAGSAESKRVYASHDEHE